MHTVKTLDLQEKLTDVGFYEIKMRSFGRYDLQLPELNSATFSFLRHDAPWMPLVHAILGMPRQPNQDHLHVHRCMASPNQDHLHVHRCMALI